MMMIGFLHHCAFLMSGKSGIALCRGKTGERSDQTAQPASCQHRIIRAITKILTSLGYMQGAMVTMAVIGVVLALHYTRALNDIAMFWIAFVFTRPFGDFLTKPLFKGGLDLGTYWGSLASLVLIVICVSFAHGSHHRTTAA